MTNADTVIQQKELALVN